MQLRPKQILACGARPCPKHKNFTNFLPNLVTYLCGRFLLVQKNINMVQTKISIEERAYMK